MAKIALVKSVEATKLHPKTGTSLGLPDVTISYGALIEYVGADRDREKFTYLGELYACKREAFLSATGGVTGQAKAEVKKPAAVVSAAENGLVENDLEWEALKSSAYKVARARVPGGWLVALNASGVTFVPDAGHKWDGGSE